jgi:hypothetical protein
VFSHEKCYVIPKNWIIFLYKNTASPAKIFKNNRGIVEDN